MILIKDVYKLRELIENGSITSENELNYDYSHITDWSFLMQKSNIKEFPLLNASNVVNMKGMFLECDSLTIVPLLDTTKVTNMSLMFSSCVNLVFLPSFNVEKVIHMHCMFAYCSSLKKIEMDKLKSVVNMVGWAHSCFNLIDIKLNFINPGFKKSSMFLNCNKLIHNNPRTIFKIINNYNDFQMSTFDTSINYFDAIRKDVDGS